MWRGGFPLLYTSPRLDVRDFVSDYISTFIEKDIARSAGIEKLDEFLRVLQLLAARVAELINFSSLGSDASVASKTVSEWIDILERAAIIETLPVYSSNFNNRLIKTPKLFFLDSGILVRLQGHLTEATILSTPQAGHLFENLVLSEAAKLRDHFKLPISLSYWRTKEGEEIDLIIESVELTLLLEVKLAVQKVSPLEVPKSAVKTFKDRRLLTAVITPGGVRQRLSENCEQIPVQDFTKVALELFGAGRAS
jgi:predicted AAA+ superfamily ATPase